MTAALAVTASGAAAAPGQGALTSSRPAWATGSALRAAPATDVVHARVYLPWRDAAGLAATTAAVSTPGSASYGRYLTPEQFRQRFAPTQADVAAVQKWLRDAGFSIADTPTNGDYVAVEGTVAQAEVAFGTRLGLYSAYGGTLRAPEGVPSVPAELAGKVDSVVGLDDSVVGLDDSATLIVADRTPGNDPRQRPAARPRGARCRLPGRHPVLAFSNGTHYDEYRIGGTSLAAPLMAGMAAVANQEAGRDLGFLNPRIYAAHQQAKAALYDVDEADLVSGDEYGTTPQVFRVNFADSESAAGGRTYSLRTLESPDHSLQSTKGYDTATGVGSPKDSSFLSALGTVTPLPYTPTRR